ncbi:hypothetical protein D3C85_1788180 [compost metagenome]
MLALTCTERPACSVSAPVALLFAAIALPTVMSLSALRITAVPLFSTALTADALMVLLTTGTDVAPGV